MSPEASAYLTHALDLMQRYAMHRKELDWPSLRSAALAYATDAQTPQQTYPAIAFACTQLRDHASSLIRPAGTAAAIEQRIVAIESQARQAAHGRRLTIVEPSPFANRRSFVLAMLKVGERRYAYLVIPSSPLAHAEDDSAHRRHLWAEELFSLVSKAVGQGAQGWIIDLRGTNGVHAQPSLAGLQSLLGDGRILQFSGPGSSQTMSIKDRAVVEHSGFTRTANDEHIDEDVRLHQEKAPVTLLIDRATQGAGESIAIAFVGRERTCLVGERTAGSTEWGPYSTLSDGAILAVMSEQVLDRHGHAYPEGLEPDLSPEPPRKTSGIAQDPAVRAAEAWLASQLQTGH